LTRADVAFASDPRDRSAVFAEQGVSAEVSTEFWATLTGAAVGVVAGTLIQFFVQAIIDRRKEAQQRKALRKEMSYNLAVLQGISEETTSLRNAVNGDALSLYNGYFAYDQGLFVQTSALLTSGNLYKWLPIDDFKKLQKIVSTLSANRAVWVNTEVTKRKQASLGENFSKPEAVNFVNFIEGQNAEVRQLLNGLLNSL
jgi:hypothetical protein